MTTCDDHTPCPSTYVEWSVWAEKKSKTHEQVQCDECKRWAIWRKKQKAA